MMEVKKKKKHSSCKLARTICTFSDEKTMKRRCIILSQDEFFHDRVEQGGPKTLCNRSDSRSIHPEEQEFPQAG